MYICTYLFINKGCFMSLQCIWNRSGTRAITRICWYKCSIKGMFQQIHVHTFMAYVLCSWALMSGAAVRMRAMVSHRITPLLSMATVFWSGCVSWGTRYVWRVRPEPALLYSAPVDRILPWYCLCLLEYFCIHFHYVNQHPFSVLMIVY